MNTDQNTRKRAQSDQDDSASKRAKTEAEIIQEQLQKKIAELNSRLAKNPIRPSLPRTTMPVVSMPSMPIQPGVKSGLAVPAHPLLLQMQSQNQGSSGTGKSAPLLLPRADFSTVKANQRLISEKKATSGAVPGATSLLLQQQQQMQQSQQPAVNPYLQPSHLKKGDPRPKARKKKQFAFVKEGRYVELGEKMRTEARLEKLKQDIAENVKKAGIEKQMDLVADAGIRREPPPHVEWWDAPFLPEGDQTYEKFDPEILTEKIKTLITNLVQHPIPIEPPDASSNASKPKGLLLTKKEQKKLRRQRRLEAQKEKAEKIRLGLLPQEQPKVKISNLMRVLGQEAVLDPTQIEARVRKEMAARQEKHEDYIAANKLTDEQRAEKLRYKLKEDTSLMVNVAVFRIKDLSHGQHKFKVSQNAQQYNLSGVAVVYSGMNLVVVEGGPKGIKKYKNLMLRRIDWSQKKEDATSAKTGDGEAFLTGGTTSSDPAPVNATNGDGEPNECVLVWEGQIKHRQFSGFRFKPFPTETLVKAFLQEFGALHYWESARNFVSDLVY